MNAKRAFSIYRRNLKRSFPYFFRTVNTAIRQAAKDGKYEIDIFATWDALERGLKNIGPLFESLGYDIDISDFIYYPDKGNCVPYKDPTFQGDIELYNKSKGGKIHIIFYKAAVI